MTASRTPSQHPRTDLKPYCEHCDKGPESTHLHNIRVVVPRAAGEAPPEEPKPRIWFSTDGEKTHEAEWVLAIDYDNLRACAAAAMAQARELSEQVKEFHDAVGALTDAEDVLSCIPEGPERDELQRVYNGSDPDDISMPFSGSIERKI